MVLLTLMDAIAVHALAAATALGTKFNDVAVGFPVGKGRCVRVFYGGERDPEEMDGNRTLTSGMVAQAINVRAYWPVSQTAVNAQRLIEGEMAAFVRDFRVRILGDSQLGGAAVDLNMHLAAVDQVVIAGTQYAVADIEIVVDYDEFTIAK